METISALFTAPGIGGIIATVVLASATAIYVSLIRWVLEGGREELPPYERMGWPFE
ncbi:MAG: hypothetical protein PVF54_10315 [Anaerolineae bacterium]|jgi:hypothetical protein